MLPPGLWSLLNLLESSLCSSRLGAWRISQHLRWTRSWQYVHRLYREPCKIWRLVHPPTIAESCWMVEGDVNWLHSSQRSLDQLRISLSESSPPLGKSVMVHEAPSLPCSLMRHTVTECFPQTCVCLTPLRVFPWHSEEEATKLPLYWCCSCRREVSPLLEIQWWRLRCFGQRSALPTTNFILHCPGIVAWNRIVVFWRAMPCVK